jgi:hypothetical protein
MGSHDLDPNWSKQNQTDQSFLKVPLQKLVLFWYGKCGTYDITATTVYIQVVSDLDLFV